MDDEHRDHRGWEQRALDRIEATFSGRSRLFVLGVGCVVALLIGLVDRLTGDLSLSVFYVIPVALVAWLLGRVWGSLLAFFAASVWLTADLMGRGYEQGLIPYWNALARFAVFFFVVSLVTSLRSALTHEHDLTMHEREISEGLRNLNDMKDTLLHAISHDLRNPLTAILGSVQTLERADKLQLSSEQTRGLLGAIDTSARKLHRMISDLLDLDRLDRGQIEPHRRPTDIRALVRRLIHEANFLDQHPARLESERVVISVDEGRVERIIENLLVNAAKYTPTGSPVCVRVEGLPDGVVITVEDEGPGVPDDLKDVIFESFRQGPDGTATGSGAGIGLSLVAKFSEIHGGHAWVEDRPGGGAAFKVYLAGPTEESQGSHLRLVEEA